MKMHNTGELISIRRQADDGKTGQANRREHNILERGLRIIAGGTPIPSILTRNC